MHNAVRKKEIPTTVFSKGNMSDTSANSTIVSELTEVAMKAVAYKRFQLSSFYWKHLGYDMGNGRT